MKKRSSSSYRGAVSIVYLCMFFEGGGNILLSATKEALMQHFGADLFQISMLFTIRSICCGVIPMLCGSLSDRFGRKRIILVGAVFFAVYYAFVPNLAVFAPMLLLIAILGVGYSFMDPSAQAILFDAYDNPTPYMPFIQVAFASGSILSPLFVSLILNAGLSWKVAYYAYLVLVVLLIAWTGLQKFPPSARTRERETGQKQVTGYYRFVTEPSPFKEGLAAFGFILFSNMATATINNWADIYMRTTFGYGEAEAVRVLSYYSIGCMVGALAASFVARRVQTITILSIYPVGGCVFYALALFMPTGPLFIAMIIASALFTGSMFSIMVGYAGQLFWRNSGAAVGAISSASALGIALSSLLAGQLTGVLGIRGVFLIMIAAAALTACMGLFLRHRHYRLLGLAGPRR